MHHTPFFTTSSENYINYIQNLDSKDLSLSAILEGHGKILHNPKNLEGIFGFGTHTCSLVCIEGKKGEIGMVHLHERIGEGDLAQFFNECSSIKKITSVGGSDTTKRLITETINKNLLGVVYEHIPGQYDATIYYKDGETKIETGKFSSEFIKSKVKDINIHIKNLLYLEMLDGVKDYKKKSSLIIS